MRSDRQPRGFRLALWGLRASAAIGLFAALPTGAAFASDHIDSPSIAQDRGADLADSYAFVDPNDRSKLVLIMSTQDFIVSGEHFGMPIFDSNIRYRFEIENTGDARPDAFVDIYFSPGLGREMPQMASVHLPNGRVFNAPTTRSTQEYRAPDFVVTTDRQSGVSFFAGNADDPFFLDDTGANRLVGSIVKGRPNKRLLGERGGRDTYAGFNTLITAVRIPISMLRGSAGPVIGVNAVTQRHRTQRIGANDKIDGSGDWVTIDRDGNPLVNNGLIPANRKDEYNSATTEDDARGRFRNDIIKSLRTAGTDNAHIAKLLAAVVDKGDILRVDTRVPNRGPGGGNNRDGGFGKMGGRRLQDDVVDMTFTMINNGHPLGDGVNHNEVPFGNSFPFVAKPHQPFPPRSGPDDLTRQ
ncbi:MAG: DUF4331 family protein [Sphingomicrobium sp.]